MNRKLKIWLSKILPFILLGSLLERWEIAWFLFVAEPTSKLVVALSVAWLGLIVASIVGIRARRRWGAVSLIALMPVSTVLLGVPLVPFVTKLLPTDAWSPAVMLFNAIVLVAAIVLATPVVRQAVRKPA